MGLGQKRSNDVDGDSDAAHLATARLWIGRGVSGRCWEPQLGLPLAS